MLPEIRNNPVVQQLSTKLAEERADLSQAKVVYGTNHPTVKKLQSQVDELQSELETQKTEVLGSIRTSYSAARARENLMDSQIKGASSQLNQMGRYNDLKKGSADQFATLYNNLYARVKEAGIAAASKSSNLRLVDEAHVLDTPTGPEPQADSSCWNPCRAGGRRGPGIHSRTIRYSNFYARRSSRDWVGHNNIAVVPLFSAPNGKPLPALAGRARRNRHRLGSNSGRELPAGVSFLLDRPHSPEAEALRSLHTAIMLSRPGNPPQVLLVVSSLPGEGKTTVAVNLAMAMAQHGTTCLVDADLRRGRVAASLGVSGRPGLTDVLSGTTSLDRALVHIPGLPNLTVLPAHAGSAKAGQLVVSDRMRKVLDDLRKDFQFVVVDSAPILPFADCRSLSNLTDGLIFVGRSGITTRELVQRSLELLDQVHSAPVLQFVVNAADMKSPQYRYYQYGYDYYEPAAKEEHVPDFDFGASATGALNKSHRP